MLTIVMRQNDKRRNNCTDTEKLELEQGFLGRISTASKVLAERYTIELLNYSHRNSKSRQNLAHFPNPLSLPLSHPLDCIRF